MGSEIVDVQVTIADSAPSSVNFGAALLLAFHAVAGPAWQTYKTSDLQGILDAGYTLTSDVYRKAIAASLQTPKIETLHVYRRAAANVQNKRLTPTVTTAGFVYRAFTVNGIEVPAYTVPGAATAQTICDAYAAVINPHAAANAVTSGVGAAAVLNITPATTAERLYIDNVPSEFTVKDTSPDAGIATDYAAAKNVSTDFFYVMTDAESEVEANALAPLVTADGKFFVHQTADSDVFTAGSSDVASDLKTLGLHNVHVVGTKWMSTCLGAGLMSKMAGFDPGFVSWHNQDVVGAGLDTWTATEIAVMNSKNVTHFELGDGLRRTYGGKAASGRFFDLQIGAAYITALVRQNVLAQNHAASQAGKEPPQSDVGIGIIEGWVTQPLAIVNGRGLLKEFAVQVPKFASLAPGDLLTRTLDKITFSGTFGGKWHTVKIRGALKAA